jgi:hypothetical protein
MIEGLEEYEGDVASDEVMKRIEKLSKLLVSTKKEVEAAEKVLDDKKKIYRELSEKVVPQFFLSNGIRSLEAETGEKIQITRRVTCSPNKNEAGKNTFCTWMANDETAQTVDKFRGAQSVITGSYLIQWGNTNHAEEVTSRVSAYWKNENSMTNLTTTATSLFVEKNNGFANPQRVTVANGYIILKVLHYLYDYSIKFSKE